MKTYLAIYWFEELVGLVLPESLIFVADRGPKFGASLFQLFLV